MKTPVLLVLALSPLQRPTLPPQHPALAEGAIRPTGTAVVPTVVNLGVGVQASYPLQVDGPWALFFGVTPLLTARVFDLERGRVVDTGLTYSDPLDPRLFGGLVVAGISEFVPGDLNGDGDSGDTVVSAFDAVTGELAHYAALPEHFFFSPRSQLVSFAGGSLVLEVSEANEGALDRNGDGDAVDVVLETLLLGPRNRLSGAGTPPSRVVPLSRPGALLPSTGCCVSGTGVVQSLFRLDPERLYVGIDERTIGAGVDLNGDGDALDLQVLHVYPTDGSAPLNLGVALGGRLELFGRDAVMLVSESSQGADLNGDGDAFDSVFHFWDPDTGVLQNSGLAVSSFERVDGHWILRIAESAVNEDLNGDGDLSDIVPHLYDPDTGEARSLGLSIRTILGFGDTLLLSVDEAPNGGVDRNGDGDGFDTVLHVYDVPSGVTTNLTTALSLGGPMRSGDRLIALIVDEDDQGADFNLDGDIDDLVVGVYDRVGGTFANTVLQTFDAKVLSSGGTLVFCVSEAQQGADLNGDGDADDFVLHAWDAETGTASSLGLQRQGLRGVASEELVLFLVSEAAQGVDLDGDGLLTSDVAHAIDLRAR